MKAIALLSGGLDSTVSMLLAREEAEVILALTIDYGQRAALREIEYSRDICREYGIAHRVVELPFMKEFHSGLMEDSGLTVDQPWVPNRNGLFLNLAAAFAEDRGAGLVICGFNREEGIDFPDNSREYVECVNQSLSFSTKNGVRVISRVQGMDKVEIYKAAARLGLKTDRMWSCYLGGVKPCNACPSCLRNLEALKKAGVV
jgi:7-cyano-7-deazaguanine synthase